MVIYLFKNPQEPWLLKDEKSAWGEGQKRARTPPPQWPDSSDDSSDGILEESSIFEMRQRTFRTGEARTESEDTRRRARVQKRNRQEVFQGVRSSLNAKSVNLAHSTAARCWLPSRVERGTGHINDGTVHRTTHYVRHGQRHVRGALHSRARGTPRRGFEADLPGWQEAAGRRAAD